MNENATLPEIQNWEIEMPARLCPYCKVVSNFTRGPSTNTAVAAKTPPSQVDQVLALEWCANCEAYIYVRGHESNGDVIYDQYPKVVDKAPEELPPAIKKAFDEALKCYGAEAPNGALLMCRRAIQESVQNLEAPKGNLPKQLQALVDADKITPDLKEWADHARVGGKIAAHGVGGDEWGDPDQIWGDLEDAAAVIEFCRAFFEYTYVIPERNRQRRISTGLETKEQSEPNNIG